MTMIYHDFQQGSPEWHQHRATHFNASDAPAMMGCSPYITRTELLHQKKTGITTEVDAATQRRFDDGHRFEALSRPLAEKIIGDDLYPVTGSRGELSASFDGLTLDNSTALEHKSMNSDLRQLVWVEDSGNDFLPLHYRVQMEQQLLVAGAKRVLFMATKWASDNVELIEERHCWYTSDPDLRAKIIAGWKQFAQDLVSYVPTEVLDKPVAAAVTALPAVSVQVSGEIAVRDNFPAFEVALRDFIENRLIRKPETDQEFADLDLQIKALKNAEEALNAAEAQMLAQVSTVDTIKRTKDMLHKLARDNRLMAEKLLAARKEEIKAEIVAGGVSKFREHIASLNERLGKPYMPAIPADFGGAVKGKRTVDSLREAVGNELTRAKIAASEVADRIDTNLKFLREHAAKHTFLFADTGTIVLKAADDLQTLVRARIAEHEAAEASRLEADRERIRAEEAAKLQREAEAKAAAEKAEAERLEREAAERAEMEKIRLARIEVDRIDEAERQSKAAISALAAAAPVAAPATAAAFHAGNPTFTASKDFGVVTIDAATPTDDGARLTLTQLNAAIAPVSIDVAGLATLGFEPVEKVKASRFYRACDLPAICAALIRHLNTVAEEVVA